MLDSTSYLPSFSIKESWEIFDLKNLTTAAPCTRGHKVNTLTKMSNACAALVARFLRLLFVLTAIILDLEMASATIDLNHHELQFVSDNLNISECERLVNSLNVTTLSLGEKNTKETRTDSAARQGKRKVEEKEEKQEDKTCFELLEDWDRRTPNSTFHMLAIRLSELGHVALAETLSTQVYDEKVQAVYKLFLSDPFKQNIDTDSPLLQEAPTGAAQTERVVVMGTNNADYLGYVTFICCATVITMFVLYALCPSLCYDNQIYKTTRKHFYKHLIGQRGPPPDENVYLLF